MLRDADPAGPLVELRAGSLPSIGGWGGGHEHASGKGPGQARNRRNHAEYRISLRVPRLVAGDGNIWVGALVGYVASRTMDAATTRFYALQSEESKRREEELAPGGTLVQFGKQLGTAVGRDLSQEDAARVGLAAHRTLGVTYGIVANSLARRGRRPLFAGLAVGSAAWMVVDEGTALPTFTSYPVASHVRGVVGHGTFGLAAGALLSLIHPR